MRWAIGDIQGCFATLERLLAAIEYQRGRDELWLAGDLVNRGPRSLDVLRWARAQGDSVISVLGNHDVHLLLRAAGLAKEKKRDTLDDVLAAPDREALLDWLRARPFVHADPHFALVHAGLHPRWSIADAIARSGELWAELRGGLAKIQSSDRLRTDLAWLTRARMCTRDGEMDDSYNGGPTEAPRGLVPWFALPDPAWATHTIVFGHWAALGLDLALDGPVRHAALDTGCVWGKSLTAFCLDDRRVVQVRAVEPLD
ncbi:MAG TPA: symmetrical bis(5'-nucleosyl)-tetraphosphatase [Kofleriaceae bacterium]|jgi:bis(5'-nucleosyl)-tetraphosphatase (symmetrical)